MVSSTSDVELPPPADMALPRESYAPMQGACRLLKTGIQCRWGVSRGATVRNTPGDSIVVIGEAGARSAVPAFLCVHVIRSSTQES
jgi:hypothetical protein